MTFPCKTLMIAAALAGLTTGAMAQSSPYGVSSFEGIYAGGYGGVKTNPGATGTLGAMAGANFAITDGIVAGAEVQGGATFGATTTYDALMLGHLGYEVNDQTMVYGAAGAGVINGTGSYAVGVGAEVIAMDQLGVRGEVLGTGGWGGGLNAAKATAGVVWHVQ